jgi:ribosomal protein L19E
MARLFVECGWTQGKVAARMGKQQAWVSKRLIFRRFLSFNPSGIKQTKSLAERLFRSLWAQTTGSGKRSGKPAETEVQRAGATKTAPPVVSWLGPWN